MNLNIPNRFNKMAVYRQPSDPEGNILHFVANTDSVDLRFVASGSPLYTPSIQYKVNDGTWDDYSLSEDYGTSNIPQGWTVDEL